MGFLLYLHLIFWDSALQHTGILIKVASKVEDLRTVSNEGYADNDLGYLCHGQRLA